MIWGIFTTFQFILKAKICQQKFWPCQEYRLAMWGRNMVRPKPLKTDSGALYRLVRLGRQTNDFASSLLEGEGTYQIAWYLRVPEWINCWGRRCKWEVKLFFWRNHPAVFKYYNHVWKDYSKGGKSRRGHHEDFKQTGLQFALYAISTIFGAPLLWLVIV